MAVQGGITLPVGLDLKNVDGDVKKLAQRFKEVTQQIDIQSKKVDELKAHLDGLENGGITATNREIQKMQSEFDKTTASIEKTKAEINAIGGQLTAVYDNAFKDPVTHQLVFTESEQAQIDAMNAKLDQLEAKLEADKQKAAEMGEVLKTATGAATQAEIEKTKQKLAQAETKLESLQVKAEDTGNKLKSNMSGSIAPISEVGTKFDKLGAKLVRMAKRVFVFSMITKALRGVREALINTLMSDNSLRNSLNQLQAAFWTAFAPIYSTVVPALKALVNWVTTAVVAIGRLIAALSGKSYAEMVKQGKALQERAAGYKKSANGAKKDTKATKDNTKALKKQLAAFDELQILQEDKNDNKSDTGGGGAGGAGLGDAFAQIENFDTGKAEADLSALHMALGGLLCTLGVVLLFTGHVGLGLGFIVAGLAEFSVGIQQWSEKDYGTTISQKLRTISTLISVSLAAIGIICLFLGQVGWGLGFIIAGAIVFGVKELTSTPWDGADIKTMLLRIAHSIGNFILIIGLILCLVPGQLPIALGCIVAGVAILDATEKDSNGTDIDDSIDKFFKRNSELFMSVGIALVLIGLILCLIPGQDLLGIGVLLLGAGLIWKAAKTNNTEVKTMINGFIAEHSALIIGVGAGLIVIGIILCFIPGAELIGIGLLFEGTMLLGMEAANVDWNAIYNKISTCFNEVLTWLKTWGLLVLGILCCFTPAGLLLGIGLIAKGCQGLAEEKDPIWNIFETKIKETWENIKKYWNEHIKKYFTAQWWGELAKNSINGFIKWFVKGLNKLVDKINGFGFDMPDVLGGGHVGFNIRHFDIPQLARGAVIPPNREFLAILGDQKRGTNIEAPLDTIKQAVAEVLQSGGYQPSGNQTIILELDGREVGRTFGKAITQEANRVGNSFVKTKLVF